MSQLQVQLNDLKVFEQLVLGLHQLFEVPQLLKAKAISPNKNDVRVVVIWCLSNLFQEIDKSIPEVCGRRLILR